MDMEKATESQKVLETQIGTFVRRWGPPADGSQRELFVGDLSRLLALSAREAVRSVVARVQQDPDILREEIQGLRDENEQLKGEIEHLKDRRVAAQIRRSPA